MNNPTLFLDTPPHHHATFCLLPLLNLPDFLGPNFRGYNFIFIVVLFWDCILITPFLFPFHYSKQSQIFFLLYFKTITSFFISCYFNAHIHTQTEKETGRDRVRETERDWFVYSPKYSLLCSWNFACMYVWYQGWPFNTGQPIAMLFPGESHSY